MKMNKWPLFVAILSFLGTLFVIPMLPAEIVTHWGINGQPDGTAGKTTQIFLAGVPILIYFLMVILPKIDPKRENYKMHQKAYRVFIDMIVMFMIIINWFSIAYNLGYNVNIRVGVTVLTGGLFMVMGNYMSQIRHNYFFGIKTPWTLANETVWKKTHKLGSYLFAGSGLLIAISAFLPGMGSFIVVMGSIFLTVGITTVYSYLIFKKVAS